MKRIAIFLSGLLALPAFAEVAPVYIDDDVVYADAEYYDDADVIDEEVQETSDVNSSKTASKPAVSSRSVSSSRVKASRTVPSGATAAVSGRASNGAAARAVASRSSGGVSSRANTARTTTNRATTNRTATAGATRATVSRASAAGAATRATGGVAGSSKTRTVSGRGSTPATRARTGTLYTANSAARVSVGVGDRVMAGNRDTSRVGTNVRVPTIRSGSMTYTAANTNASSTTTATSTTELDELAELTDYCKAQYANCMDNYCNVLDDNQGRCSCSANLKNYSKAETTLKQVTEELQEVAQKIKYIGLNTRDVETLFTQTEAELKMQSTSDNSNIKNSLDKIRNMIVDVQSGSSTGTTSTDVAFDLSGLLDFNIDSTGFDLSAFLGSFSTTSNTSSIKNQRGEQLYKTATARCKANVLNSCVAQGVDAAIITNSYDLEIDKQCIAYERSLNDSNDQMAATVRNAKFVLQNARLLVSRQKNEYSDMRQCVSALDSCMQDDFVCGSEYEKCLDPTGRYIVNGELVVGSQPGQAIDPNLTLDSAADSNVCKVNLYKTWNMPGASSCTASNYTAGTDQGNAWGTGPNDTLSKYIDETVTTTSAQNGSVNMSEYLQNKIGYVDNSSGLNYGMCVSVLNKCQDYTYTGAGTNAKYNPKNDVIKQYLARVLVQIKSKQDEILNDYAANCVTDVTNCLNQNNYPTAALTSTNNATNSVQQRVAINACRANILTCMSVTGYSTENPTPTQLANWVYGILGQVQTTDNSNTYQGYVQNQLYVRYSCGVGSVTQDASQQMVTYNETFDLRTDACQQQNGYTCNYYWQGQEQSLSGSINYPFQVSKVIEYRCTEQTDTYSLSGDNSLNNIFNVDDEHISFNSNATLDVGVSTGRFTFNTNLFTVTNGYTCAWRYNNRTVRDGDTVEWDRTTQIVATCDLDSVNITYTCSNGVTSTATAQPNAQITLNGCNDVTGYACHYEQDDIVISSPASFNTPTVSLTQICNPNPYLVTVYCGENATPEYSTLTCTYGEACNLSGSCTANTGYSFENQFIANDSSSTPVNGSFTYNYTEDMTFTAVVNPRTATLNYSCTPPSTTGSGGSVQVVYGQPVASAAGCAVNTGYNQNSCFYVRNNETFGTVGEIYTSTNFSTQNSVSYKCNQLRSTVTFDCDIWGAVDQTPVIDSYQFNQGYNRPINNCIYANDNSGYTCNGWLVSGTDQVLPEQGTWPLDDGAAVTLIPNCSAGTYEVTWTCGIGTIDQGQTTTMDLTYGELFTVPDCGGLKPGYNGCYAYSYPNNYLAGEEAVSKFTASIHAAEITCNPNNYNVTVNGCDEIQDILSPREGISIPFGRGISVSSDLCFYNPQRMNCVFSSEDGYFYYFSGNSLGYVHQTPSDGNISANCCYVGECNEAWCSGYDPCSEEWCTNNNGSWDGASCKTTGQN